MENKTNNKQDIIIILEKLTKKDIVDKLIKIINDYSVKIEDYFVVDDKIDGEVKEIFDFYNSLGIKKQRELDTKLITLIKKSIKLYGKENVLRYIKRYNLILKDERYYFSYKRNLTEVLSRKEGITSFTDEGSKWLNYMAERPIYDTTQFFDVIWDIYPNKQGKEYARVEFDKKFVGVKSITEAKNIARNIYLKAKEYAENCDETYIKNFANWLRGEIKNGK